MSTFVQPITNALPAAKKQVAPTNYKFSTGEDDHFSDLADPPANNKDAQEVEDRRPPSLPPIHAPGTRRASSLQMPLVSPQTLRAASVGANTTTTTTKDRLKKQLRMILPLSLRSGVQEEDDIKTKRPAHTNGPDGLNLKRADGDSPTEIRTDSHHQRLAQVMGKNRRLSHTNHLDGMNEDESKNKNPSQASSPNTGSDTPVEADQELEAQNIPGNSQGLSGRLASDKENPGSKTVEDTSDHCEELSLLGTVAKDPKLDVAEHKQPRRRRSHRSKDFTMGLSNGKASLPTSMDSVAKSDDEPVPETTLGRRLSSGSCGEGRNSTVDRRITPGSKRIDTIEHRRRSNRRSSQSSGHCEGGHIAGDKKVSHGSKRPDSSDRQELSSPKHAPTEGNRRGPRQKLLRRCSERALLVKKAEPLRRSESFRIRRKPKQSLVQPSSLLGDDSLGHSSSTANEDLINSSGSHGSTTANSRHPLRKSSNRTRSGGHKKTKQEPGVQECPHDCKSTLSHCKEISVSTEHLHSSEEGPTLSSLAKMVEALQNEVVTMRQEVNELKSETISKNLSAYKNRSPLVNMSGEIPGPPTHARLGYSIDDNSDNDLLNPMHDILSFHG